MYFVWFINTIIVCTIDSILGIINKIRDIKIPVIKVRIFQYVIPKMPIIPCIDLPLVMRVRQRFLFQDVGVKRVVTK